MVEKKTCLLIMAWVKNYRNLHLRSQWKQVFVFLCQFAGFCLCFPNKFSKLWQRSVLRGRETGTCTLCHNIFSLNPCAGLSIWPAWNKFLPLFPTLSQHLFSALISLVWFPHWSVLLIWSLYLLQFLPLHLLKALPVFLELVRLNCFLFLKV